MEFDDSNERTRGVLRVRGANEHNLCGIDLDLRHGEWTAISGPSGSGKSSLVFDVLVREGERRYLGSLSTKARQFFGKLGRADVASLTGLPVPIAVGRRSITSNPRSTVGTQSGVLDLLRLLFAREATHPDGVPLTRAHFGFNGALGACEACAGLGVEDEVDPALLVADPSKSIRAGALVPTLPSGYTVYSQVTVDVMDTICRAHGFTVDTPWAELDGAQRNVILFGTKALEVPFGKHSLESRMKWEGITARPREFGHYRGLVPVIRETLERNRNPNILRFVRSVPCTACGGARLGPIGREARLASGVTLPELVERPAAVLAGSLADVSTSPVFEALREPLASILERMVRLGLGHLTAARPSSSLSGGEAQRLRLAAHLSLGLGGALFALDEPTLGLHPSAHAGLCDVLDELVARGNTLVVVEHDPDMVEFADRVIELGPGAGPNGGRIVGDTRDARGAIAVPERPARPPHSRDGTIRLTGATLHNLKNAELVLHRGAINVVIGPSGAGKSSLVFGTLLPALTGAPGGPYGTLDVDGEARILAVDARPMGRSSRSTPATWSGVMDAIRKRFAATDGAKARGLGSAAFSFNGKAGRCAACEGLGFQRVGLHLLEDAVTLCPECRGRRYRSEVLDVELDGRSIADVLELSIEDALGAFRDDEQIEPTLNAMVDLGIGYLRLGTPSTTLSSGESQRIRLATILAKPAQPRTLFAFDEPDRGLHPSDLARLIAAYDRLVERGHTIVAVSHHRQLWAAADHLVEVREGVATPRSLDEVLRVGAVRPRRARPAPPTAIRVRGARTHNLRGVDVDIPHGRVTAIVGPSGSGKSSLAFGTIAAEAWARFTESLPYQVRRYVDRLPRPDVDALDGLTPTIALRQEAPEPDDRSTLATLSGLAPLLRLAWARFADVPAGTTAAHFRPASGLAACADCGGRGALTRVSLDLIVTNPDAPIGEGALNGTKPGRFFTEPDGQHLATMRAATGDDLARPWNALPDGVRKVVLEGAGDRTFDVTWAFARGKRTGEHRFQGRWEGILALVLKEAARRASQKGAAEWRAPLVDAPCPRCSGSGLALDFARASLGGLEYRTALGASLSELRERMAVAASAIPGFAALWPELEARLDELIRIGLGAHAVAARAADMGRSDLQRVRLGSVLRADLAGVTVVLDEPDAGLSDAACEDLALRLRSLARNDATVIVVTHRAALVDAADHVVAIGPGAGSGGGIVVGTGALGEVDLPWFATAAPERVHASPNPTFRSAALDVDLPTAGLVALVGPPAARTRALAALAAEAEGAFEAVVDAPRSVGATSPLHALDAMRALQDHFAAAPEAKGLPKAAFSYLSPSGRCPACAGRGFESVAMDFMADLALPCEACGGTRYRPEALAVRVGGQNVAELLATPVAELDVGSARLTEAIEALTAVGLGHVSFGRAVRTLSGGERQRLALAAALGGKRTRTLYLLDEPESGLANADLAQLIEVFRGLAARDNLVVCGTGRGIVRGAATVRIEVG